MAVPAASAAGGVHPAQLGFLAIFNPSLGPTDETLDDQIVYYASVATQNPQKRRRTRSRPTDNISQEERHERLRQIGLAQGMASFSRGFAGGAPVDTIDTDKSRVILHELEPGWWILASIDLTKLPLPPRLPTKTGENQESRYEYSSKEMKPANLLLRDLLRAHSIFLMHHDTSLSALFVRSRRLKFVAMLSRYWDLFLSTWNVMLHGNPARNMFNGINMAASGELGVGVGEEDRGSGEREVLEGLVGRIEGLADLVVSKFGSPEEEEGLKEKSIHDAPPPWLGEGREPEGQDGAIFLGVGALSRKSLRDVTHWMEDLYTWGEHAYGVIDSPTSVRRRKGRKASKGATPGPTNAQGTTSRQPVDPTGAQPATTSVNEDPDSSGGQGAESQEDGTIDKMVSYLKLGYGSYWTLPGGTSDAPATDSATPSGVQASPNPTEARSDARPALHTRSSSFEAAGHYLIGLKGEIEEGKSDYEFTDEFDDDNAEHNSRTVLRTVNLEIESEAEGRPEATIVRDFEHPASVLTQSQVMGNMVPGYDSHDLNKAKKLRVVVYVNRPFVFTFFFNLQTDSLAWDTLYRSLHYQLSPLKKSLLASTTYRPERPDVGPASSSISDLVWDPDAFTVHCTIPNIPEQYDSDESWSRADAISTHLHLLHIHSATRRHATELERTEKTGRGWWIVWTRMVDHHGDEPTNLSTIHESAADGDAASSKAGDPGEKESESDGPSKEVILIRRASDHARFRSMSGALGDSGSDAPGKLAQGIGIDTRKYIEQLLSLL